LILATGAFIGSTSFARQHQSILLIRIATSLVATTLAFGYFGSIARVLRGANSMLRTLRELPLVASEIWGATGVSGSGSGLLGVLLAVWAGLLGGWSSGYRGSLRNLFCGVLLSVTVGLLVICCLTLFEVVAVAVAERRARAGPVASAVALCLGVPALVGSLGA